MNTTCKVMKNRIQEYNMTHINILKQLLQV